MRPFVFSLMIIAAPAAGLDLEMTGSYALNRPASLEYDPDFCGLWIANESREVILVTLEGEELRRFSSDLPRIKAITVEDNHLLVADGFGSYQRLSKNGEPLADPFASSEVYSDIEGMVIDADGTIITVEDDPERLSWSERDGTLIRTINTMTLTPPLSEPQGIARDPRTGHLLIVDDWEGTNSLYEFDAEGTLLNTAPLLEYGTDPEGIAIRPGADELFVAFDGGARIVSFRYTPTLPVGSGDLPIAADCAFF